VEKAEACLQAVETALVIMKMIPISFVSGMKKETLNPDFLLSSASLMTKDLGVIPIGFIRHV
jgi:hypothetical protein